MRDMVTDIITTVPLVPAVQSATIASSEVDLKGCGSVTFLIPTGAIASAGNFTPVLEETDDPGDSPPSWAEVDNEYVIGAIPTVLAASSIYRFGYSGGRRYIRVRLVKNSGTSIAAAVIAVKGHVALAPTS